MKGKAGESTDVAFNKFVDCRENVLMAGHVVESIRSVLFYPVIISGGTILLGEASDHGNVSSASTGRFAALLLPLVSAPKVMVASFLGASSMSMSSSKSDIVKMEKQRTTSEYGFRATTDSVVFNPAQ